MIYLNGHKIESRIMDDGTTQLEPLKFGSVSDMNQVEWIWEREEKELLVIAQLKTQLDAMGVTARINIPYMPYSLADEPINFAGNASFRTFYKILNSLEFTSVNTFDPHSTAIGRLINNFEGVNPKSTIQSAMEDCGANSICFPSTRLANKYAGLVSTIPFCIWDEYKNELSHFIGIPQKQYTTLVIIDHLRFHNQINGSIVGRLQKMGVPFVDLYVSHAMFSDNAVEDLQTLGYRRIFTKEGEVETAYTKEQDGDKNETENIVQALQ